MAWGKAHAHKHVTCDAVQALLSCKRKNDVGAMAAEAGRETRRDEESDEESDGCNEAQDSARVQVRNTH